MAYQMVLTYMQVFEYKKIHSEPSLFIYIKLLYKSQMNRVVYSLKVKRLCTKRFTTRLVYIIQAENVDLGEIFCI